MRVPKVRILKATGCQNSKLEGDMLALWICRIESLEVSNIVIITAILFFRGAFTHPESIYVPLSLEGHRALETR